MIGVKIEGGFGNQLFQYAFAYAAARRKRTWFTIIFNQLYKFELYRYFDFYPLQAKIGKWKQKLFLKYFNNSTITLDNLENPEKNLQALRNNSLYKGFYQSELYFQVYREQLLKKLKIKNVHNEKFRLKYGQFFSQNRVAVVHLRRQDYLIYGSEKLGGKGLELPMKYYEKFLNIYKADDNLKILFISDDIEFVKEYFGQQKNYYYEQNEMIVDFQLLINADILCLANSSFSWWGAYLNQKKEKKVYSPKYWLGFKIKQEYPVGIIANGWEIIDFTD